MPSEKFESQMPDAINAAASTWLARRDRGFSSGEHDAYLQWLKEDSRHREAVGRLGQAWRALDALVEWRPKQDVQPDPDLLARPFVPAARSAPKWFSPAFLVAAAAAAVVAVAFFRPGTGTESSIDPPRAVRAVRSSNVQQLSDGSVVELNASSAIAVEFTDEERRVRLVRGEAHFSVASNPLRPFVVSADKITIRAVGTAFNVRLGAENVDVLVTEGKVQVGQGTGNETSGPPAAVPPPIMLASGYRATVSISDSAAPVAVDELSPREIETALAWQGVRLEFPEMMLDAVAEEFNRHNRHKLIIGEPAAGQVRVGGNFRADNVEAFVRLLETSFDVKAERIDEGRTILRMASTSR